MGESKMAGPRFVIEMREAGDVDDPAWQPPGWFFTVEGADGAVVSHRLDTATVAHIAVTVDDALRANVMVPRTTRMTNVAAARLQSQMAGIEAALARAPGVRNALAEMGG